MVTDGGTIRLTDEQARAILAPDPVAPDRAWAATRSSARPAKLAEDDPGLPGRSWARREQRHGHRARGAGGGEATPSPCRAAPRSSTATPSVEDEDLIAREDMVITVTHGGYVKRTPLGLPPGPAASGRQGPLGHVDQGRGRGHPRVLRLDPHADAVLLVRAASVYKLKVWRLPPGDAAPRAARPSSTCCRSSRARASPRSCRCRKTRPAGTSST